MPITYPRTGSDWFDMSEFSNALAQMEALLGMRIPVGDARDKSGHKARIRYRVMSNYAGLSRIYSGVLRNLRSGSFANIEQHLRQLDITMMKRLAVVSQIVYNRLLVYMNMVVIFWKHVIALFCMATTQ